MSLQAIILAGGLGTRLRSVVSGLPKAMAPVAGRPFLEHVLAHLANQRFERIILAVGYRAEAVRTHFGERFGQLAITYSEEDRPLGTGGAAWKALALANPEACFILNGDTWIDLDYGRMLANHLRVRAQVSVAVRQVPDVGRYGAVDIDDGRLNRFSEKGGSGAGFINAGVYLLRPGIVSSYPRLGAFSFERDFLQAHLHQLRPSAWVVEGRFIDIGVPGDLERAQRLLGPAAR